MQPYKQKKSSPSFTAIIFAACAVAALIYYFGFSGDAIRSAKKAEADTGDAAKNAVSSSEAAVDLKPSQLDAIKIEPAGTYSFPIEREVVGSVAYHEKDTGMSTESVVSDSARKFIVANVPESSSPLIHVGQAVEAKMTAYPDQLFSGKISAVGVTIYDSGGNPAIDPTTHRIAVRCEIDDPKNELYPGMLATVTIQVDKPVQSLALPINGIVRKGDGTMTAWVTKDRKHFEERIITVGLQQNGYYQVLEGLKPGEWVVTDGAIFVSNMLYAPPSD